MNNDIHIYVHTETPSETNRGGRPRLSPNHKQSTITFSLPKGMSKTLKSYAATHHIPVSAVVRLAVSDYLDENTN